MNAKLKRLIGTLAGCAIGITPYIVSADCYVNQGEDCISLCYTAQWCNNMVPAGTLASGFRYIDAFTSTTVHGRDGEGSYFPSCICSYIYYDNNSSMQVQTCTQPNTHAYHEMTFDPDTGVPVGSPCNL